MKMNRNGHPVPETVGDLKKLLANTSDDTPLVVSSHGHFHHPGVEALDLLATPGEDDDFTFGDKRDTRVEKVMVLYR